MKITRLKETKLQSQQNCNLNRTETNSMLIK